MIQNMWNLSASMKVSLQWIISLYDLLYQQNPGLNKTNSGNNVNQILMESDNHVSKNQPDVKTPYVADIISTFGICTINDFYSLQINKHWSLQQVQYSILLWRYRGFKSKKMRLNFD